MDWEFRIDTYTLLCCAQSRLTLFDPMDCVLDRVPMFSTYKFMQSKNIIGTTLNEGYIYDIQEKKIKSLFHSDGGNIRYVGEYDENTILMGCDSGRIVGFDMR